jgi:inosine-uridine nucleoside N-ribohydrolase
VSGPLIVDVDTGVDDALALAYLSQRAPELLAITTVAGNVPIDMSTGNTLKVQAWLGKSEIPVHRGASRPLGVPYLDAAHVHGTNGLGDATLPESDRSEAEGHAVEAILRLAERYAGELTVLTLGPMTNLAIALNLRPGLVEQIRRVVVMGGSFFNPGNITPHAEFNVYADPHAAQQVFVAVWTEVIALGLDVTHQTVISRAAWEGIADDASLPALLAKLILRRSYEERRLKGVYLHDPLAALTAIDSEFIQGIRGAVEVTLDGDERGRTVFREGEGNVVVARSVRAVEAERTLCEAMGISWESSEGAATSAE